MCPFSYIQVYDAITNQNDLPLAEYPDSDAKRSIIEFHACEYFVELQHAQAMVASLTAMLNCCMWTQASAYQGHKHNLSLFLTNFQSVLLFN